MVVLCSGLVFAANTFIFTTPNYTVYLNNSILKGTKINYSDILNAPTGGSGNASTAYCALNQVLQNVTVSGGQCITVSSSSGTVTSVTRGFGFNYSGTDITTTGTLNINDSVMQRRVYMSCPGGESIRDITINGSVTCEVDTVGLTVESDPYYDRNFNSTPVYSNDTYLLGIIPNFNIKTLCTATEKPQNFTLNKSGINYNCTPDITGSADLSGAYANDSRIESALVVTNDTLNTLSTRVTNINTSGNILSFTNGVYYLIGNGNGLATNISNVNTSANILSFTNGVYYLIGNGNSLSTNITNLNVTLELERTKINNLNTSLTTRDTQIQNNVNNAQTNITNLNTTLENERTRITNINNTKASIGILNYACSAGQYMANLSFTLGSQGMTSSFNCSADQTGSAGGGITTNQVSGLNLTSNVTFINITSNGNITMSGLKNCNGALTVDTDANGNLVCGVDATGGGGSEPELDQNANTTSTTFSIINGTSKNWSVTDTFSATTFIVTNASAECSPGFFTVQSNMSAQKCRAINASLIQTTGLDLDDLFSRKYYFREAMFESVTTGYNEPWIGTAIGAGTSALVAGTYNHPGTASMSTSATASSGYSWQITGATTYLLGADYTTQVTFKPATKWGNGTVIRFGFQDIFTNIGKPVDGCFFNISQNDTTTFMGQAINMNNSVASISITNFTLQNNTWYNLRLYVINNTHVYYRFGNETELLWSEVVEGRVPTLTGRETSSAYVAGTIGGTVAAIVSYMDYISVGINRTITR